MTDMPTGREPDLVSTQIKSGGARMPRRTSADILQGASAVAGTAAIVYVVGGMVMWLRFRKAGLPPDHAVALMERQQLLVIGLRLMVLPAALTGALAWLVLYHRGSRSAQLPRRMRRVLKAFIWVLVATFALLLPFSFASATWVVAATLVIGYLRYERRQASLPPTDSSALQQDAPRPERPAEVKRGAAHDETGGDAAQRHAAQRPARERVKGVIAWLSARWATSKPYMPFRRRIERRASPFIATMLVVLVAAAVSLGRQLDQPVQLLDAEVGIQDSASTINGVFIGSDDKEIFIGLRDEIKAIPRSTVRDVTLGPPRELAPSPSIMSRILDGNRFAITPFVWWCNGERYGWGDAGDLCQTQIELDKKKQTVQRRDLAGDAVPLTLRCPAAAKKPCRGFLQMSSKNHYRFGPAGLPRPVVFRARVRPRGAPDSSEAGIAPGQVSIMCLPVDNGQRGLLRNVRPVEDPTPLDAGTTKRGIPFNVTISADEEGRNVVRSESYIVSVTRPDQPIEYWGECSTLTVRCEGTAGTKSKADIRCTVRATKGLPGQITVTIVRAGVRFARGDGDMDGKTLVVRPVAIRTLTPGRYQAVVLLKRGKAARKFWTYFDAR